MKVKSIVFCLAGLFLVHSGQTQAVMGKLLDTWADSTLPASNAHDNIYNEIWGIVQDGREYAVIGSTYGTHFIDVTDPGDIVEVVRVRGGTAGPSVIHRDYHDHAGYLYAVCDEGGASTLQIMDLQYLPDSVSVVYDSQRWIRRSHNIFIDTAHARMYALYTAGVEAPFAPLRVFDISDPMDPKVLASYSSIEGATLSSGVHDAFVKDHIAFLNVGYNGLVIADFTKADSARLITSLHSSEYPDAGYNHSGWPSEDGSAYYMADENHGFDMKVIDTRQLPDIRVDTLFDAESPSPFSIPHNQVVAGDYLYVAYYFDGLQVYDIRQPFLPKRVMYYPTSKRMHADGKYQGAWGIYPFLPSGNILVSDMQEGLFVIESVDLLSKTVDEVSSEIGLSIRPNPAVHSFTLKTENSGAVVKKVELSNVYGQRILTWDGNRDSYDVSTLSPGAYWLKVKTDTGDWTAGFIKQN